MLSLVYLTKKLPKLLTIVITLISIVMVFFVYNGATHNSNSFSSLYLIEYQFQNRSDIYTLLDGQYSAQHGGAALSDFSLKVGYNGLCIKFADESQDDHGQSGNTCGYTEDIISTYQSKVPLFTLTGSNSTSAAGLELFELAKTFQQSVMKKAILIVLLITLLALILEQIYSLVSFLPLQLYVSLLILFTISCALIIQTISLIWLLVADTALTRTGYRTSLKILSVQSSFKPQSLMWTVFAFLIILLAFYTWDLFANVLTVNRNKKSNKSGHDLEMKIPSSTGYYGYNHGYNKHGYNHPHYRCNPSQGGSVMSSISTLRGNM